MTICSEWSSGPNHEGAHALDGHHLAQLNIARPQVLLDDPLIADFVNNLDRINQLAESAPGFVWRLQDDTGNPMDDMSAMQTVSFVMKDGKVVRHDR